MTTPAAGELPALAYSIADTAKMLSLSDDTIYRLIAAGQLARVKIGTRTLITAKSITKLLEDREGVRR